MDIEKERERKKRWMIDGWFTWSISNDPLSKAKIPEILSAVHIKKYHKKGKSGWETSNINEIMQEKWDVWGILGDIG